MSEDVRMERYKSCRVEIWPNEQGLFTATRDDWCAGRVKFILDGEMIEDVVAFTTGMAKDDSVYKVNYLRNLGPAKENSDDIFEEEYNEILVDSVTIQHVFGYEDQLIIDVDIVRCSDWVGLYINKKLVYEGHDIPMHELADRICGYTIRSFNQTLEHDSGEYGEIPLPKRLED